MNLSLPPLPVAGKNKLLFAAIVGLIATLTYGAVGAATLRLSPRKLAFGSIDSVVPFEPWTFWIYASVYLIYALSSILQRDERKFQVFLYGYLLANLLSASVFLIFPTIFPRELYPLDTVQFTGSASARALSWFRTIDQATNCLPSMHVGCAVISTLPFFQTDNRKFVFFSLWALAISVATLTTKQHYFLDVIAGGLFGLFCYRIADRFLGQGSAQL